MAISKERKEELVAQYTELLQSSQALIVTEYRGLTNAEMHRVRRKVVEANGVYHVTKVTLLKRAMDAVGLPFFPDGMFDGPIALGFCFDDVPGVAKALLDATGDVDFLIVRGGLLGDRFLSAREVKALAQLPPLDVMQARLLGLISAPAANLAGVLVSGRRRVVDLFHAYSQSEGSS